MKAKAVDRKGSETDSGSEKDGGITYPEKAAARDRETVTEVQSTSS